MAVKKKAPAKKKAPVKKKAAAKKKSPAKKIVKKVAKKATKKAPVKKKAAAKKKAAVKKVVKKKVVKKKVVKKKSPAKKSTSRNNFVVPPVPVGGVKRPSAVSVSTTPTPAAKAASSTSAKPKPTPKQATSPRVIFAAIIGIAVLAVIVISRPASDNESPAPVATQSASAPATPSESAPEMESGNTEEAVAAIAAPTRFIGNWKDSTKSVMVITWEAPNATAGLTGYKFEVRSNMGEWTEAGVLPVDQLSIEFTKGSSDGATSFRVTSVYSDGQVAEAKAFGFAGAFN